jgi:membrane-anchored mycosin MYCP
MSTVTASVRRSRGTRSTSFKLPMRATGLLLVAGIGVLSPTASAVPAWAQQTTTPPSGPGSYFATPPDVIGSPPLDPGGPSKSYVQDKQCVQRNNLGPNLDPKGKPWGQQYLQIEAIQKIVRASTPDGTAGGGIKVAVIDTGVTPHPYFQNRLQGGGEYVKRTSAGDGLEDCDGHGTEVAGIIAANPPKEADIGFIGVAPDATIVSIRQSSQNYKEDTKTSSSTSGSAAGTQIPGGQGGGGQPGGDTRPGQQGNGRQQEQAGSAGDLKSLAQAVVHAANVAGMKVINMSVDNCRPSTGGITDGEAQLQAAIHYAVDIKDVVVVAAAGNTSTQCAQNDQPDPNKPKNIVTPPWFAKDVLSVAAIDESGGVAPFSVNGPWVTVAAPGTKITSLDPASGSSGLANLTIEGSAAPSEIQGTSFAAPYVAGVAALVRAKFPALGARAVMNRITSTSQHPGAPGGRDTFVGFGVVNPMAALTASVASEDGIPAAKAVQVPSDLPPLNAKDWTPMIVALAGAGGGLVALLITLFVVHTVRRSRPDPATPRKPA